jgi:pilus assembly protein CpaF
MMGAAGVPDKVIRQMLTAAIHLVIHMTRLNDGSRKVTCIAEVRGVEDDMVVIDEIFRFERWGQSEHGRSLGAFRATGHIPKVLERLKAYGVHVSPSMFTGSVEIEDR